MKLIIDNIPEISTFFKQNPSIVKSYGIFLNNDKYETKFYTNNYPNIMGILSLDEILTRLIYPSYETGKPLEDLISFTSIEGDINKINEFIDIVLKDESNIS